MPVLQNLRCWVDPVARPGPEAMAVDQWLLENSVHPILRVYSWLGSWGSIGCFGKIAEASIAIPGLRWVRRCTGGGTVDHRADWTYSLVIPRSEALANTAGAESYHIIHRALAHVLQGEGRDTRLSLGHPAGGNDVCFRNPVHHDLIGPDGSKIAGAGQRRTRDGLLHQGSVAAPCSPSDSLLRASRLAAALADHPFDFPLDPPAGEIDSLVRNRYGSVLWLQKR